MSMTAFDLPFRNELPIKLSAALLQQGLKCRANRALVSDPDGLELAKSFVIILDGLVCCFEVESFHELGGTIDNALRRTGTL